MALVSINDDEPMALAQYMATTDLLMRAAGARIKSRFRVTEGVVGKVPAQTMIIVEYPDRTAIGQVFESAEYQAIRPIRDRAFLKYQVSVVTNDGDPVDPIRSSGAARTRP